MPLTPLRDDDPVTLGPYDLMGRLGQGGMGTVFLGLDEEQRAVAVKVLRDGLDDVGGRARFERELDALQRVRGPHLVEVLDSDVGSKTPWIVTRFVPGRRLDETVDRTGPLEEPALRRLADGLAQGLHVLHKAGVVHRDLSPGNVLMVDEEPQIIDLGLAVFADSALTRTGLLLGTAGYLAPEQVVDGSWSPAVDVHAWGAVVAYAATGRPPFGSGRPDAVLYRVVHDAPDLLGVPAALHGLLQAALDKDPARRPTPQQLGAGLAVLPDLVGVGSGPQPGLTTGLPTSDADLTALLGPQATSVLADHRSPDTGHLEQATQTQVLDLRPAVRVRSEPAHDERPYDARPYDERPYDARPYPALPDEPSPPRLPRWPGMLLGLSTLLCAVACGRRWPVVTALVVLAAVVLAATFASIADARQLRRERRGLRPTDGVRAVVSLPWHLLRAAGSQLLTSVFWAGVPFVVGGVFFLADAPGVAGAAGVGLGAVLLLAGSPRRSTRARLRGAAARLPTFLVLTVTAVLVAVAYAVGRPGSPVPTSWWPFG